VDLAPIVWNFGRPVPSEAGKFAPAAISLWAVYQRPVLWMLAVALATGCRSSGPRVEGATGPTPAQRAEFERQHPRYTPAGVAFASGMVEHHAQAIVMAGWAPTHDAGPAVRDLCARIGVSQTDEIKFMQDWLRVRHLDVPAADTMAGMAGMPHSSLMPGMLTPAQMAELDGARGAAFDRLFLTDMIMHHQGALDMVRTLQVSSQGEDNSLMTYATNVAADQSAEIGRMQRLLTSSP
jgi:uncharacterized protein (DUF305 family)